VCVCERERSVDSGCCSSRLMLCLCVCVCVCVECVRYALWIAPAVTVDGVFVCMCECVCGCVCVCVREKDLWITPAVIVDWCV